jgi:hypothetical protein
MEAKHFDELGCEIEDILEGVRDSKISVGHAQIAIMRTIKAAARPQPGVSSGHVLVPIEPTRAMLDAGHLDLTLGAGIDQMLKYAWSQMLDAAPTGELPRVKLRLTSGEDGVFAHFQIDDGYQCGVNLDHIELCKRFCDEYRAALAQSGVHS